MQNMWYVHTVCMYVHTHVHNGVLLSHKHKKKCCPFVMTWTDLEARERQIPCDFYSHVESKQTKYTGKAISLAVTGGKRFGGSERGEGSSVTRSDTHSAVCMTWHYHTLHLKPT